MQNFKAAMFKDSSRAVTAVKLLNMDKPSDVMYLGRIVEEAETKALFANPRHPYTHALLASVLTPEPQMGLPETHLGIAYPNPIDPPSGCTFNPRCPHVTDVCKQTRPETRIEAGHLVECHHPQ